jgi:hypothetical protein
MTNRRNREQDEYGSAQWVIWGYILLWIALQGSCEMMDAYSWGHSATIQDYTVPALTKNGEVDHHDAPPSNEHSGIDSTNSAR